MTVVYCSECSGFGAIFTDIDNKKVEKCPKCNGKGKVEN
jgi:DnaJ-class molecular chaperone